jgi:hypothetical protein
MPRRDWALPDAARELESSARAITARDASAESRDTHAMLTILAQEYRAWAARPPTRDNARRLGERAEEVVWVAMKVARQAGAPKRAGRDAPAIRAAEAAVLSQRIPRLHLWRRWGIRDEALLTELRLSEAQLHATLATLRSDPSNTPEIAAELQLAENQAAFLAQASASVEAGKDVARQLEFVAKTGDHVLESMERVARSYAALE